MTYDDDNVGTDDNQPTKSYSVFGIDVAKFLTQT